MPILIDDVSSIKDSIELDEAYELLIESKFDSANEESFCSVSPILKKLNNNKTFLADIILEELKEYCENQHINNAYTAQVIMLKTSPPEAKFFMRANFWPARHDLIVKVSGTAPFVYDVPHDHNFNFMTAGYFGPGYWSEYYEYDYNQISGYPGEDAKLTYIEKRKLDLDKLMLYRAHKDVHNQMPPDNLSVSINIMQQSSSSIYKPQHIFTDDCKRIKTVMHNSSAYPLYELASVTQNGIDILLDIFEKHPLEYNRINALKALMTSELSISEKEILLQKSYTTDSKVMEHEANKFRKYLMKISD